MRRTLRTSTAHVVGVRRGLMLVVDGFSDLERGPVECPAAPAVAAWLGGRAKRGAVTQGDGEGRLVAVSWVDRQGHAAGLGVAVHRDDRAVAESAVARWTAVLRSRRLLVAGVPLCAGGRQAERLIRQAREQVYVLGRPIASSGFGDVAHVDVVERVDEVSDRGLLAFPAHGAGLAARAEAGARGLRVLDATCPLAASAQADAARYAARGDTVVVIGSSDHAETAVLTAQAGERAVAVRSAAEAGRLTVSDDDRVAFVVDPAMPVEQALEIVAALRSRFPALAGHHFDALCEHASDQAAAYATVIASSDVALVLGRGGMQSVGLETDRLKAGGGRVLEVQGPADLNPDSLAEVTTIGILTGSFTPTGLEKQVVRMLSGLGPVSVRRRSVQTSPTLSDLPVSVP